jgi:hypothetical protein
MKRLFILSLAITLLGISAACGQETISVSSVEYPVNRESNVGNKKYSLKLTGAAMRKKAIFNVYAIGSYVERNFAGRTAEELARVDIVKQLHMVMQRSVSGDDMARAFKEGIRNNYPTQFNDEIKKLCEMLEAQSADKGDHVWITNIPGYGIYVEMVGKKSEFIPGVKFAKALWEIYLGPKNIGEAVKKGLTSRL